jgi:hypothetical protein
MAADTRAPSGGKNRLNESSSNMCDPFGFCQESLQQFEFAGGLVLRF